MIRNIPRKLLLVEDEAITAENTKMRLQKCGYTVFTAADAEEAVAAVREMNIDLILMDIELNPGKTDGIEAASIILEQYDLPLIFLSNHTEHEIVKKTERINSYGYIERSTSVAVLDATIKTALRLFNSRSFSDVSGAEKSECGLTERELEKTRLMLNDVLNTIPISVFWKDLNSVYLGCNRLFALDSGKSEQDEIIGLTDFDIRTPERAELNRLGDRAIIESGEHRINYEEPFLTPKGEKNWINTSKIPLRSSEGRMYGILGMYENITERKQMAEELLLQKNRLANILYGSNVGTWEWNVQTGENIVNEHWASIIGYSLNELPSGCRNFWREFVHTDDLKNADELLEKLCHKELEHFECEFRMRHKKGHWIWVLSRGNVAIRTEDDKPLLISGTHLDINERKLAQDEILNQLSEKETILKEVHHRIKNNFSSICSLLSLQAESVTNKEAEAALQAAIGRVHSMQVLYEKLLIAEDCRITSLKQYLGDLVDDIVNVFPDRTNISIEKHICDCALKPKQLFPLGIIVNELVTNVMKYAFTGRQSGIIHVTLDEDEDNITLVISDNGNGLPEGFDLNSQDGFGLMLIRILCQQLNGDLSIENSMGTKSTLRFKVSDL